MARRSLVRLDAGKVCCPVKLGACAESFAVQWVSQSLTVALTLALRLALFHSVLPPIRVNDGARRRIVFFIYGFARRRVKCQKASQAFSCKICTGRSIRIASARLVAPKPTVS